MFSSDQRRHPKVSRKGLYDTCLTTIDGEGILQKFDDYAAKVLLPQPNRYQYVRGGNGIIVRHQQHKLAYAISDFDYSKLKLFFLSVLWRISASARPELRGIKLADEEKLRQMVLSGDPGELDDFSILIYRCVGRCRGTVILPYCTKMSGISFIRFVCGGLAMHIKIDKSPMPDPLSYIQLRPDSPLIIELLSFTETTDFRIAKHIVESHQILNFRHTA